MCGRGRKDDYPELRAHPAPAASTSCPFRDSAEDLVRGNVVFKNYMRALHELSKSDMRVKRLMEGATAAETASASFPINSALWLEYRSYLNAKGPGMYRMGIGNIVCIATTLVQQGVSLQQTSGFMDRVTRELRYDFDKVRIGSLPSLPPVLSSFAGNTFSDKLKEQHEDLLSIGSLNRSVGMAIEARVDLRVEERIRAAGLEERTCGDLGQKKLWPRENKETHMRAAWQELDAPGYSTGDTEGDAAQAKRARLAIEGDVPEVSGEYDLTSAELSYSGIIRHKQNKIGLVVILRVMQELRGRTPQRACLRSCVFGGCTVAQCDYDHDRAPLTDEQRLKVLRRARDLILAGKATLGV